MRSLSAKLIAGLVLSLAGVLLWLGSANLRVLRENLETTTVIAAQRVADVVFRSTREGMLHNDRAEQIHIINSIAAQPGVKKIRVLAKSGAPATPATPARNRWRSPTPAIRSGFTAWAPSG
jgi:hypothetical protein